ncbi:MAG: ATP-binding protein [Candidatus Saccharibacteria bacterium]|nr:ATP-binding protein [Candidatus Saccharibacteria bacterium]
MRRIRKTEGEALEFKSCRGRRGAKLPENLWQSISAFANTRGGSILLGVRDDGEIEGLTNTELDALQKDASTLLRNGKFNRQPNVDIVNCDTHIELIVHEAQFYDKPIFSKKYGEKNIHIRLGATTVQASDSQKKSMFAGASGGGENQQVEGDISELVDAQKVDVYIDRTGLKSVTNLSLVDKLRKLKAVRQDRLTIFGLIAFGKDGALDEQLNNVYIDFKYFRGKEKVSDDLSDIYKDRREFHGDIRQQFEAAFAYLMGYIKKDWPVGGAVNKATGLREDVYVLPEEAFREALANAIAHRDYLLDGSCVNINLFSDRVEMTNPGESLVAIEDLEKTDSKARNPILMEYLKTFQITDKSARGILTIKQAARKKGLLDPKFENVSGSFRAVLYFAAPYSDQDSDWVKDIAQKHSLKDTQQHALVYIKNNGAISNREYCEINHMTSRNDDRRARRELSDMVELGVIRVVGKGPGTKYVLS